MYKKSAIIWCMVALFVAATNAAIVDRNNGETGVAELTKDQFDALVDRKNASVDVQKVAEHRYSGLKPIADVVDLPTLSRCQVLFNLFYAANLARFQDWTNKYCLPYRGSWCCPNGRLCKIFYIYPAPNRCAIIRIPPHERDVPVFEPYLESVRG